MLVLQVIDAAAFSAVEKERTALFIFHNSNLWNVSLAGPLENITIINISYNTRLETLDINMPPNSSLETLILSNNNLTTVSPEWFINTPNLTEISLAYNSFSKYSIQRSVKTYFAETDCHGRSITIKNTVLYLKTIAHNPTFIATCIYSCTI